MTRQGERQELLESLMLEKSTTKNNHSNPTCVCVCVEEKHTIAEYSVCILVKGRKKEHHRYDIHVLHVQ